MRKSWKIIVSLALSFLALSGITRAAVTSVGEPLAKWNKVQVNVCWGNGVDAMKIAALQKSWNFPLYAEMFQMLSKSYRLKIQTLVEREFNPEATGISFIGWETCDEAKNADVVLLYSNGHLIPSALYTGYATIGGQEGSIDDPFDGSAGPRASNFVHIVSLPRSVPIGDWPFVELNFLHELGHVAGLRHEHIRPEAADDALCANLNSREAPDKSTQIYGAYDPSSIMSYCYEYQLANSRNIEKLHLSAGDKHALRCLYTYKDEQFEKLCHTEYDPAAL